MVDENQDLFTTLYAQRLFFLVTSELKVLKFQPIGRTEARMMLENRLRILRRSGNFQEYDQLQGVFQLIGGSGNRHTHRLTRSEDAHVGLHLIE